MCEWCAWCLLLLLTLAAVVLTSCAPIHVLIVTGLQLGPRQTGMEPCKPKCAVKTGSELTPKPHKLVESIRRFTAPGAAKADPIEDHTTICSSRLHSNS